MAIPLVIIAGPTGIGKTQVAMNLAERLRGEIVSADSMQVYRFMNIGTAKPTPEERARVPHHLIDVRDPDEDYSAADYARDASEAIRGIVARGHLPFVVGGTGLYIHALLYGIFAGPGRDDDFRAQMRAMAEEQGAGILHQELQRKDPETAQRLHPNDLVRIIRALEVFHLTGMSITEYQATATTPVEQYDPLMFVLTANRKTLYAAIRARVEKMMAAGWIEEIEELYRRGYHRELRAMNSLGYKEIGELLSGSLDLPATIASITQHTCRYAKRQLTWFRQYPAGIWISRASFDAVDDCVAACLQPICSRFNFQGL